MATQIIRPPLVSGNPLASLTFVPLRPALVAEVRTEMRRIEAAADWRALVAECASGRIAASYVAAPL